MTELRCNLCGPLTRSITLSAQVHKEETHPLEKSHVPPGPSGHLLFDLSTVQPEGPI